MDIRERLAMIDLLAKGDDSYCGMLEELRILERSREDVLSTISEEQQDILCDYLTLCEEISHRKLEIACTHMRFRI